MGLDGGQLTDGKVHVKFEDGTKGICDPSNGQTVLITDGELTNINGKVKTEDYKSKRYDPSDLNVKRTRKDKIRTRKDKIQTRNKILTVGGIVDVRIRRSEGSRDSEILETVGKPDQFIRTQGVGW